MRLLVALLIIFNVFSAKGDEDLLIENVTLISSSFANQPGLTTYQEMKMMAEAGIPCGYSCCGHDK